jgi:UBX domain
MSRPRRVRVGFMDRVLDLGGKNHPPSPPLFPSLSLVFVVNWDSAIPGVGTPVFEPQLPAPPTAPEPPKPAIDPSQPQTTLQLRLTDGTRLVTQFNLSSTMEDIYAFVARARPTAGREFVLQTIFPTKVLERGGRTVEEEGLKGGTVVMRWKA